MWKGQAATCPFRLIGLCHHLWQHYYILFVFVFQVFKCFIYFDGVNSYLILYNCFGWIIVIITSLENQKVKILLKLDTSKNRKKEKKFIVEGKHLVDEARKKGVLLEAYSLEEKDGYIALSKEIMKKICNTDTVVTEIGLCKIVESTTLSDKLLILDGVQDPGNMGALMRSAKAFGFDTIIIGNGSCDIYNDKVIRASQGAIFKLSFIHADLLEIIPKLSIYDVYGTNVVNGIELDNVEKKNKMAIVLGNEGNGISKEVQEILKKNIYIPMSNTESLNVSVAGSIIMYKLRNN